MKRLYAFTFLDNMRDDELDAYWAEISQVRPFFGVTSNILVDNRRKFDMWEKMYGFTDSSGLDRKKCI
jgi:hypothetical protein